MRLYKVAAVVLRARDCGGGDKLLTLYSREYGKMKVMAHGVAKPYSRKRGAVQPFVFSKFLLRRGRELDTVSQCEAVETFSFLGAGLGKLAAASYLAELVDAFTAEWVPGGELFTLFRDTLRLMGDQDNALLLRSFEIKIAGLTGYRPVLDACAGCHRPVDGEIFFSPEQGGVLCAGCGSGVSGAFSCNRGLVEVLKTLLSWQPARLHQLKVEPRVKNRIKQILFEYLRYHMERDLKSTALMNRFHPGI
jgi:DNA repair protein RecO (recombination protein O)